jgi:phosphoglycolate phosphatase-like HAD superfamily hydrolase
VKVLVHGASLARDPRATHAAAGLALRGHHVVWLGGTPPGDGSLPVVRVRGSALWIRDRADLVIAGGDGVLAAAASGWCAGAHAMLVSLDPPRARTLGWVDRWAWGSVDTAAILAAGAPGPEEDSAEALDPLDRWSNEPLPERPDATHPDVEILERAGERWIARRRGHAPRAAVFLDRDGTLVVEKGYLSSADDLELMPAAARGLALLRDAGYALVVVSNQSGVGRGFFPLERVYEAMARLRVELRAIAS